MTETLKVNGQQGSVSVQKGQEFSVTFEGMNDQVYLYNIGSPDLLYPDQQIGVYNAADTVKLTYDEDTTLVLRAYDNVTAGFGSYPTNDVTVTVGAGGGILPNIPGLPKGSGIYLAIAAVVGAILLLRR